MAPSIHLYTLGTAAIQVGDTRLTPGSSRAFAALVYLVAQRGRAVTRSTLHSLLYPSSGDSDGLHSVRQLLYRLRSMGVAIKADGDCVALPETSAHSDYESLLAGTLEWTDVEKLCNGFLSGFAPSFSEPYCEWLDTLRSDVSLRLLHRLNHELAQQRAIGRWDRAAVAARACLALDPMNEEATLALAESFAAEGSKSQAVELLDGYVREIGGRRKELSLPATLLRRRIAEQFSDDGYAHERETPFLGRDAEMRQLRQYMERARAGEAQSVLVSGDAGIGKSRLVGEFTRVASLEGTRVATVLLQPSDIRRPLAPFMDVIPAIRQMPGALGCSPAAYNFLARLTDSTPEFLPDGNAGVFVNASRAIRELLDAVCAESPLVLLIEDAHWMDELSVLTVGELAASTFRRCMLVLTSREARRFGVAEFARWSRLPLGPLSTESAEQLLATFVQPAALQDAQLRTWLVNAASGNPYFLCELGRHFRTTGERFAIPASVKELLGARLDALDDRTTTVFDACALLGRHATLERLRTVLGIPTMELATALRRLEHAALLVDRAPLLRTSHELLSDVAKHRMPSATRKLLHAAIADVLEHDAAPHDDAVRWDAAEHHRSAGNEAAAVRILTESAAQARAVDQVQRAVEYTARAWSIVTDADRKLTLTDDLIHQAAHAADWPRVLEAIEYLRSTAGGRRALGEQHDDIELFEVDATYSTGRERTPLVDALKRCVASREAAPAHRLHAGRRLLCIADELLDETLAELALSVIDTIPESDVDELDLLHFRIVYHLTYGDRDRGTAMARSILAHTLPPQFDMRRFLARQNAAMALYRSGDTSEADALHREHYEYAVRHGAAAAVHMSAAILAWMEIDRGNLAEGHRWNDIAEAAQSRSRFHIFGSGYTANCARLAILERRPLDARRVTDYITSTYASVRNGRVGMVIISDRMRIRQLEGCAADDDDRLAYLLEMHPRACRVGIHDDVAATIWYALDERGRTQEANRFLSNYLRNERRDGYPPVPEITQIFDTGRFVPSL